MSRFRCERCQKETNCIVAHNTELWCNDCHCAPEWNAGKAPYVVSDEIPGGFVQENFGHEPEIFYSKREMARRAKELGLEPMVRHIGEQGSDKSSKTTRWI